jgi:hypothetical protein
MSLGGPCNSNLDIFACRNKLFLACTSSNKWVLQNVCEIECKDDISYASFCTSNSFNGIYPGDVTTSSLVGSPTIPNIAGTENSYQNNNSLVLAIVIPICVLIICLAFILFLFLSARKRSNSGGLDSVLEKVLNFNVRNTFAFWNLNLY